MKIAFDLRYSDAAIIPEVGYCLKEESLILAEQLNFITLQQHQEINFQLKNFEFKMLTLEFFTRDCYIINNPLEIENVILDDFYQIKNLTYRGVLCFSKEHHDYITLKNIKVNPDVSDSNRLDFTGKLVYQFKWPFFRELC
jgi:hypothetical protein